MAGDLNLAVTFEVKDGVLKARFKDLEAGLDKASGAATKTAAALRGIVEQNTGLAAVSNVGKDRAADIQAYGRAMDDTRASLVPLYALERDYKAQLDYINKALATGAINQQEHAAAMARAKAGFASQVTELRGVGSAAAENAREFEELRGKYDPLYVAGQMYEQTLRELKQALDIGAISQKQFTSSTYLAKKQLDDSVASAQSYDRAMDDTRASLVPLYALGRDYKAQLDFINQALATGAINQQEHAAAMARAKAGFASQVTGLRGVGSAAAENAREFEELRAKFDPLYVAGQKYEQTLRELKQALDIGAISQKQFTASSKLAKKQFDANVASAKQLGFAFRGVGGAVQQAGYQIGDLALMLQNGSNPIVAITQQGSQLVSAFGPAGAAIGAVGAIVGALAVAMGSATATMSDAEIATEDLGRAQDRLSMSLTASVGDVAAVRRQYEGLTEDARVLEAALLRVEERNIAKAMASQIVAGRGAIEQALKDVAGATQSDWQRTFDEIGAIQTPEAFLEFFERIDLQAGRLNTPIVTEAMKRMADAAAPFVKALQDLESQSGETEDRLRLLALAGSGLADLGFEGIGSDLASFISKAASAGDAAPEVKELAEALRDLRVVALTTSAVELFAAGEIDQSQFDALFAAIDRFAQHGEKAFAKPSKAAKTAAEKVEDYIQTLQRSIKAQSDLNAAISAGGAAERQTALEAKAADQIARLKLESTDARAASIRDLVYELDALEQVEDRLRRAQEDQVALDRLELETSLIGESAELRAVALATYQRELDLRRAGVDLSSAAAQAELDRVATIERARLELSRQQAVYDGLTDPFVSGLDAVIDRIAEGQASLRDLADIGRSVFADLQRTALQMAIANPLKNALFGLATPTLWGGGYGAAAAGGVAATGAAGGSGQAANLLGVGGLLFNGGSSGLGTTLVQGSVGQALGLSTPGITAAQAQAIGVMPVAGSSTALGTALTNGLNAAPWGIAGSLGASMLGFEGTGNAFLDMGLGAGGSIAGGALGGALAGTAIGGPVGAVIGGFGAQVIGSLFGGGKSVPSFGQTRDITDGETEISQYTDRGGASAGAADGALDAVVGRLDSLIDGLGGGIEQVSGLQIVGKQNKDGNWTFRGAAEGQNLGESGDINEIANRMLFAALKGGEFDFSELGDQVESNLLAVLENSAADSFDALAADLQFAATDFGAVFDEVGTPAIDQTASSLVALGETFYETQARADALGLSTDGMAESFGAASDRLLDSAIRAANGLGAVNSALAIRESYDATAAALVDAGQSTDKAGQLYTAQMTALVESLGDGAGALDQLITLANELAGIDVEGATIANSQAAEVRQRLDEDLALRRLAAEVALGTASEESYQTQELLLAQRRELANVTDEATRGELERIHALERQAQAAEDSAASIEQFTSAARGVSQWLDKLVSTDLGAGSRSEQLAAARSNFDDQLTLARAGDVEAYGSITTYAETLIAAQRAWSASGEETATTIGYIEQSLASLPAVQSYEAQQTDLLAAIRGTSAQAVVVQVTTMAGLTQAINDNSGYQVALLGATDRHGDRAAVLLEGVQIATFGVRDQVSPLVGLARWQVAAIDAVRGAVDANRASVDSVWRAIDAKNLSVTVVDGGENGNYRLANSRARGGYLPPGMAVVGEGTGGAEVVDFARPAQVYSNSQLHDALRSGNGEIVQAIDALREAVTLITEMASDREIGALRAVEERLRNLEMAQRSRGAQVA